MPSRIVREGILTSESVAALSLEAELFYRCLMSVVDDYGRYEDNTALLRARCFPLKLDAWPIELVDRCLAEVSQTQDGRPALVERYEVNGKKYLEISNFNQKTRSQPKFPGRPVLHLRVICPTDALQLPSVCARISESESLIGDGDEVGDGVGFSADAGFTDFKRAYPKETGLHAQTLEHWYVEALGSSPADEYSRIMAGLERMKSSGTAVKYLPTAEDFIRKKRYLEKWEPERDVGGRSEVEALRKAMEARR